MKFSLNGIHFLCILLLISCATVPGVVPTPAVQTWTYDGDLNPAEFGSWDVSDYAVDDDGYYYFVLANPDVGSAILEVLIITKDDMVLVYSYMLDDGQHIFAFDWDRSHFGRVKSGGI